MMTRKRDAADTERRSPTTWMITYTDLCILLMTFFVLLISMSVVDQNRRKKALNSLDGVIGFTSTGLSIVGNDDQGKEKHFSYATEDSKTQDYSALRDPALRTDPERGMDIFKEGAKVYIRIMRKTIFLPDSCEIRPDFEPSLALLAGHLSVHKYDVEIRGYTDAFEGVGKAAWARSSWELSLERALSVYNYLREHGVSAFRLSAHGFSFYRPLYDSIEYPSLRARNERVEIVLGTDENLPSSLYEERAGISPYFNYKNFFFKLFPMPSKGPVERNTPDGRGTN
jgi:chemotaxis protein MotB